MVHLMVRAKPGAGPRHMVFRPDGKFAYVINEMNSTVTAYAYDTSGRFAGMTYPSGRTLTYGFDALGRVNQVTTTKDSQSQTLVSSEG